MTPPAEQVGTRLMFENDRVRVWDLALVPGRLLKPTFTGSTTCSS
ncbi:hypothetical protein ACFSC4_21605 [Deinococcus malanensis]